MPRSLWPIEYDLPVSWGFGDTDPPLVALATDAPAPSEHPTDRRKRPEAHGLGVWDIMKPPTPRRSGYAGNFVRGRHHDRFHDLT